MSRCGEWQGFEDAGRGVARRPSPRPPQPRIEITWLPTVVPTGQTGPPSQDPHHPGPLLPPPPHPPHREKRERLVKRERPREIGKTASTGPPLPVRGVRRGRERGRGEGLRVGESRPQHRRRRREP